MTFWGHIANTIANPTLNARFVDTMGELSRPGVQAILPLEGAVIVGRSGAEAKRSGWLGFQERFLEEIVVAMVWLYGVKTIKGYLDGVRKKALKDTRHLDMAVDWGVAKGKSVDLSNIERYTRSFIEGRKLVGIKASTLGISVAVTLGILGIGIPWLNQLKTKWIINRFFPDAPDLHGHGGTTSTKPPAVVKGNPVPLATRPDLPSPRVAMPSSTSGIPQPWRGPQGVGARSTTPASGEPSWSAPGVGAWSTAPQGPVYSWPGVTPVGAMWPQPMVPAGVMPGVGYPVSQQLVRPASPMPVRFGHLMSPVTQTLSRAGHWIQNSDYGEILVTDLGITSGRGVVAAKRSPFESFEIIFRDALSLYFYIWAVPNMSDLLNKVINPFVKASIALHPKAATVLMDKLQHATSPSGEAVTAEALKAVIEGISPEKANTPRAALQDVVGTVRSMSKSFDPLLEKELQALFPIKERRHDVMKLLQEHLAPYRSGKQSFGTPQVSALLEEIAKGQGAFEKLAGLEEQGNLTRAVKQAFRHSVGITGQDVLAMPSVQAYLQQLTPAQRQAFQARLSTMAEQEGQHLLNSLLRRSILEAQTSLGVENTWVKQAEVWAGWAERSATRYLPLKSIAQEEAQVVLKALESLASTGTQAEQQALAQVSEQLTAFVSGGSKSIHPPTGGQSYALVKGLMAQVPQKSVQQCVEQLAALEPILTQANHSVYAPLKSLVVKLAQEVKAPESQQLIRQYHAVLEDLLASRGRLFSLDVEKQASSLVERLDELLLGGLKRDRSLLAEAARHSGNLVENLREYARPKKLRVVQQGIDNYLQTFVQFLERETATAGSSSASWTQKALGEMAQKFVKLSTNSRVLVQCITIPTAMLGLGILVPKLQFWLTRFLTGKDQHPGIAAVSHGHVGKGHARMHHVPELYQGPALNRDNFSAFKHA